MANLEQIKKLNLRYSKTSDISRTTKSFSLGGTINFRELGGTYHDYFENGKESKVVLLFIDICNFSTKFKDLKGTDLAQYFDDYYDLVIPIIYEYGGEIDKIIGDGIICMFGKPFLNETFENCLIAADKCAKKIIKNTYNSSNYESKIAFHYGYINFFRNKSGLYEEFTMIGKPLTELFRLESISENNRINYFVIYKYFDDWTSNFNGTFWNLETPKEVPNEIKGVDYKYHQTNKYFLCR